MRAFRFAQLKTGSLTLFIIFIFIFLLFIVSILSSCAVGPDFHSPKAPHTQRYTQKPLKQQTADQRQQFVYTQSLPKDWWAVYHSEKLNQLIELGLKNSPDLVIAKERLNIAEQTLKAQKGYLLWPQADANLSASRSKIVTVQYGINTPGNIFSLYNVVASGSYNLDLFGKARRQVEYYCSQVDLERYRLMAAYLSLSGNIVSTAISIASLTDQINATQSLIQANEQILKILEEQYVLGGASQADVLKQKTETAKLRASLAPLTKMRTEEQHALAVLTGTLPSESHALNLTLSELHLPRKIPVTLPSNLVKQRPDILMAEATLHGASAKIGVATANLLPQISLAADFGWIANEPATLFTPISNTWDYGMSVLVPGFHGGGLWAERKAAKAAFEEYYGEYQKTVLTAFKEVANALKAIEIDAEEYQALAVSTHSAKQSLSLNQGRYALGGQDYLSVLRSRSDYWQTQIDFIKSSALRYSDTAALFYALGGGWWHDLNDENKGNKGKAA